MKRILRIFSIIFTLALVLGLALVATTPVAAATSWYVDPTGTNDGSHGTGPGTAAWQTIQYAIDHASSGDTIMVAAGTYAGNINISKSSLTIVGDPGDSSPGPGVNAPVIDGGGNPDSAFFIQNGVHDVTIEGFEMKGFTSTSAGVGNGIQAWVASTSGITIKDNYFHDLGWNAVLVGNDGALGDHSNWTISDNIVEDYDGYGLELTNASDSTIENNVVEANNSWTGILCVARRSESNITISNNTITGTLDTSANGGRAGIYVLAWGSETSGLAFDGVSVTGNTLSITSPENLAYIRVYEVAGGATVTNVVVHDNNLAGAAGYALQNSAAATIDARYDWWGDNSGPYNASLNPGGTGSAVSDKVDFSSWTSETATATGSGTASFAPSTGTLTGLTAVGEGSLPAAAQATKPINFPNGLFSFNVTGLSNGQTVTVTITLPSGAAPTQYWKYHASEGGWIQIPMTVVGPSNVISITLVDGGLGDDDGLANGVIVDQGGPGTGTVGWEIYPISKVRVLLPWIALLAAIAAGVSLFVLRRHRTQT